MKICVHNQNFHVDDVLATALLLELYPDAEVVRSRDPEVWATCDIVADVGGEYDPARGRFDHHQISSDVDRDNGIRYSSAGLIWKHYGRQFCPDEVAWQRIDERLVMPVDANDNGQTICQPDKRGVMPFGIEQVVRVLLPLEDHPEETRDGQFKVAVELARVFWRRLVAHEVAYVAEGRKLVALYEAAADKRYVVADESLPSYDVRDQTPELLYIVYPAADSNSWRIGAVSGDDPYIPRRPLPKAWRSLSGAELVAKTGVADAQFCHRTGFRGGASSREGAIHLVKLALENN